MIVKKLQTAEEYEKQYNEERGDSYSQFHGYAYDAVWTAAATIKNVIHKLHEKNKAASRGSSAASSKNKEQQRPQHWSIHNFIYRDPGWENLFLDALRNVNITGVTVSHLDCHLLLLPTTNNMFSMSSRCSQYIYA